ncbi:hypothetical protein ACFW16_00295 [Inquilinus sp. NPDC058860]|uniref:hypothetical protein n=1 Tax=Inquilinus sp. NPDC058860 TaxID=3346652 RepID=UPI00369D8D54
MSLLRHPRPAGLAALLMLGLAAAGPAFARTGLQSEHTPLLPQTAQADSTDAQIDSGPSFDHGENAADRGSHRADIGHDRGARGHDGGHGGDHGGGRGR